MHTHHDDADDPFEFKIEDLSKPHTPTPLSWVIDGVLKGAGGLTVIYGEAGAYKSFLALDMALTLASGRGNWHGRRAGDTNSGADDPDYCPEALPVVYVAAEGADDVSQQRIPAWLNHHKVQHESLKMRLVHGSVDLRNRALVEQFIDKINPFEPEVLFFDTFGRMIGDGDENAAKDVNQMIESLEQIQRDVAKQIIAKPNVTVIHHTSKRDSKNPIGSSALQRAADTMFHVECSHGVVTVTNTKNRSRRSLPAMQFTPVSVKVGKVESQVLTLVGAPSDTGHASNEGNDSAEDALAVLREHGSMRYGEWSKAAGSKGGKFDRITKRLVTRRLVRKDGKFYSPVTEQEEA